MSSTSSDLRILLLQDDPNDAQAVTTALERVNPAWVVRRVESEPSFSDALDSFIPDVIISEHRLNGFSCNDALKLAQTRRPGTAFLVISTTFEQTASDCLKSGAADFIRKADLSRLGSAITTAIDVRAPLRRLSARQLEVLQLLAAGNSTREIAQLLSVSVKTVETHRAQVMRRLGIRDLAGLVRYAIRVGLVSATQ
jgi:DNA-binding NarL/FixJ family response regulator